MSVAPKALKEYLVSANLNELPHQVKGVNWCLSKETYGFKPSSTNPTVRGGLIADEMGLGKTIQIIGTMLSNPKSNTLIVLPRSLLEQWMKILTETTNLSVYLYHGSKREVSIEKLKSYQVIVTTYGLIATHSTKPNNPKDPYNRPPSTLHAIYWSRIIYDEAHHMRNSNTAAFNGAKLFHSKITWLITGTPIQNSENDLYNLCEILGLKQEFYSNPDKLNTIINKLILKRTKDEANLKLPKLTVHEIIVDWQNENEKKLAQEIHSKLKFSNTEAPNNAKMGNNLPKAALPLLSRSRQLCILPALTKKALKKTITPTDNTNPNPTPNPEELEKFINDATGHTSKLNAVIKKIIENKSNGKKKLIFCHYHEEIDLIKSLLEKLEIKADSFDGRTSQEERETILNNSTNTALVLQIQTGCEGLNLQQYSEIYFISPHWNPAIEDQAIARAHRIGQKNPTNIYRFKMAPFDEEKTSVTIDEHACNIQNKKREVMKMINITKKK